MSIEHHDNGGRTAGSGDAAAKLAAAAVKATADRAAAAYRA